MSSDSNRITSQSEDYEDREQSLVKQIVLKEYLLPAALIIGSWSDLIYIDCCAGPWNSRRDDLSDTSFAIAVETLRTAKKNLAERGLAPKFTCVFIEEKSKRFKQLEKFCESVSDIECIAIKGDFTNLTPEIDEILRAKRNPFPFFFIDPTGWNAIKIEGLRPFLQRNPGEVLINFMTSHIKRFLTREGQNFETLLGAVALQKLSLLHGDEREDGSVFAYANEVMRAGNYDYVCTTVIPNPAKDQSHFHLIYGTRHLRGVEKFKEAERKAFNIASGIRHDTRARKLEQKTKQPAFSFDGEGENTEAYLCRLRNRFLQSAEARILEEIESGRVFTFETLKGLFLRRPLVWERDLRDYLAKLKRSGKSVPE